MGIRQTTPPEASALLSAGYRYVDVRTEAEFAGGHPAGAVNIPVALPDPRTGQMSVNPEFLTVVAVHFPKDTKIVVGCSMGGRSQRAADLLAQAGFADVVNMQGGFDGMRDQTGRTIVPGWSECGLPVSNEVGPTNSYAALRAAAAR